MANFTPIVLAGIMFGVSALPARALDFTVTNVKDNGNGSLAQAITDANSNAGPDRILFNIPGAGVHKIDVSQTPLPGIAESLFIDGYSQPGAKPNSLAVGNNAVILIQVDGGGTAGKPSNGLNLQRTPLPTGGQYLPSNYTIRGLSLTGFVPQTSGGYAITTYTDVDSAVVVGNFIGLLPDGETPRGNYVGVQSLTIGGSDPASRNVISGNTHHGVFGAVIKGNYIGTNAAGTKAVPNAIGVYYTGSNAVFGGTEPGAGNVISGNTTAMKFGQGYYTYYPFPHNDYDTGNGARIEGNLIGVAADGLSPLPNKNSIDLSYGANNTIGGTEPGAGNVIAFNGSGIRVSSSYSFCAACGTTAPPRSDGNRILSNAIYANAALAIDLSSDGPTANDPGDTDDGPNTLQNSPVINNAEIANGSVTITGSLNSTANTQFTLQYFSESLSLTQPRQTYLGSTTVTTDGNGNATFSATFPLNETNVSFNMTATSPLGSTSEFTRNAGRLRNISTRGQVSGDDNTLIGGFIVRGEGSKYVIIRALGPSLPFGAASLSDPVLEIHDSTGTLLARNDNWREDSSASSISFYGLAPSNDLESALGRVLSEGAYTVVLRGNRGSSGVALFETYDVWVGVTGDLANISSRGLVQTGDAVMIAGFIVEQGNGASRVVARALGPSLGAAGINNPLSDPALELHDSQGTTIATNFDWRDTQQDDLSAIGLAPTNDREAAIFTRLEAGPYTAIVRGTGNTTGVALVEVYNLH